MNVRGRRRASGKRSSATTVVDLVPGIHRETEQALRRKKKKNDGPFFSSSAKPSDLIGYYNQ